MAEQASTVSGGIVGRRVRVPRRPGPGGARRWAATIRPAARAAWWSLTETDIAGAADAWGDVVAVALRAEAARAERARARRRTTEVTDAVEAAARAWRLSGRSPERSVPGSGGGRGVADRAGRAAPRRGQPGRRRLGRRAGGVGRARRRAAGRLRPLPPRGDAAGRRRPTARAAAALLADAHATCARLGAEPLREQVEAPRAPRPRRPRGTGGRAGGGRCRRRPPTSG